MELLQAVAAATVVREGREVARAAFHHTRPYTDWAEVAANQRLGQAVEGGQEGEVGEVGVEVEERPEEETVECPERGVGAAEPGGSKAVEDRAATVVGIPKISRYTDFFQNSVFLEAKGGALLYVQKSVKLGKTWQNLVKLGKKGVNPNFLVAAL